MNADRLFRTQDVPADLFKPKDPVAALLSLAAFVVLAASSGCASFKPAPASYQPHVARAQTRTNGPIIASVAVLSRQEAAKMFGLPLHKKHVQSGPMNVAEISPHPW